MSDKKKEVFETELALCRDTDGFGFVIQWAWTPSAELSHRLHAIVWRVTEAEREDTEGRMVGGFDPNSLTNVPVYVMFMRYDGRTCSNMLQDLSLTDAEDLIHMADMIKYVARKAARLIDPSQVEINIPEDEDLKYFKSVPFESTISS